MNTRILACAVGVAALVTLYSQLPEIAAGALLHPWRREVSVSPPAGCHDVTYDGAGVQLSGWRCAPGGESRANLVLLHGIADNRASLSGKRVPVAPGTLCLHGDQPGAVAFAKAMRAAFKDHRITVAAP